MTSMDDGLILNLADTSLQTARKHASKGGRWTDRLKAKRSVKRKRPVSVRAPDLLVTSHEPMNVTADGEDSPRARKKPRRAIEAANIRKDSGTGSATLKAQPVQPRSQIISSLFTSNPSVEIREEGGTPLMISRPTNAPLADQTTFSGLGLNPLIGLHLASKLNIQKPTEIQREVLANLLSSPTGEALQHDLFISSQTGSGKTLAYLLPILQDLLPLSSLSYIDRTIGTLAIIIAPTRELAKQISEVLEKLLTLRLRQREDEADDDYSESTRLTRWLVSGLFSGGATRAHEKARIRKGLPIVVATPGRLLDHLQNTSTFNVSKCRWLVLDEADRLMDLGFEDTLKGILQALDGRRKLAMQAIESGQSTEVGGWEWKPRRTILVSATIREDVQHLAGTALVNPILIKAVGRQSQGPNSDVQSASQNSGNLVPTQGQFTPPAQLSQKYIVVPLKLRLVTLIALLRTILSQSGNSPAKIIVFLSCTNSVDYHWHVLGSSKIDGDEPDESNAGEESSSESDKNEEHQDRPNKSMEEKIRMNSPLLPGTSLYRLHGSLPLSTRLASLKGFNEVQKDTSSKQNSAVLFCTSVASRGLDLPLVRAVIQYDLPTENGVTEYVHRVGRTARAGKGGEAWSFVAPSEQGWVKWIEEGTQRHTGEQDSAITLRGTTLESVLRSGFGSANHEARATEVQLSFERWVLKDKTHGELARKAFQSSVRAYATHPASEKEIFHIRRLHLGHFAKAFALREAPSNVASSTQKPSGSKAVKARRQRPTEDNDQGTEKRMRDAVRAQGKSHKKDGVSRSSGVSEFQISGGYDLEELVAKR